MKYILTIILIAHFTRFGEQKASLKGNYKIEFEKGYEPKRILVFNDSIFSEKASHPYTLKGSIEYGRTLTQLNNVITANLIITFRTSDIEKDTIPFQLHDRNSRVMNYLDFSVNRGILTKVK